MNRPRTTPLARLAALAAALALAAAPAPLAAASPCSLGFLAKSAPTIDGQGADWADASRATSASDGCVGKLHDSDMLPYDVAVSTKRYMRGGVLYLGFMFEVQDATETQGGGGLLTNGERIAIQFDHNRSGGAQLEMADMRLVVTHRWESGGGDPEEVANVQSQWGTGSMAAGICGGGPRWANALAPANYSVKVRKDFAGGYRVELEFPAAAIGGVTSDFGVAFQVVNDWGAAGMPNSSGNSFPSALPYTTVDNAVDGCNNSWRVPGNWGTGYWASAAGDVTISRLPQFWQSPDIVPLACGVPGYTYYPANPCRLTLQATVHSTFTSQQTRNLLYLWADHGASPTVWRVVGMKKNVPITATGNPMVPANTTQAADQWTAVPTNLANHPCVRVYILPPVFQAAFDEADIMGISTAAELAQMVTVYGVQAQHWAQKNISAAGVGTICPNGACRVAALEGSGPRLPASFGARMGWPFAASELAAQEAPRPDTTRSPRIFVSSRDRRTLGTDNALVQVRAWGYSPAGPADSLKYVLAENLGGLLQAIPLRLLDEKKEWPLTFTLGNPGRYQRTVFVTTETEIPRGAAQVRVNVRRDVFKADEQREVRATLVRGATGVGNGPAPGGGKACPVSIGLAMVGLALLGLSRRRRG